MNVMSSSSAMSPAVEKRHYSIDLSLELEHQLDMESLPPTPAPQPPAPSFQLPDIDPHVLAHIISQLRHQLTDMTKERDDLLALLSAAHTKEAELEDALQHITDKAMSLDEALSDSRRKNKDDDEAIMLLRTKVEESRRGLMRLQAESRRQSSQPGSLDISRANAPSAFSLAPPSSKRASFTPITGTFAAQSFVAPGRPNGHRRISSVSDSNVDMPSMPLAPPPASNNRRLSGFFGRSSPPQAPHKSLSPSPSPDELEKLRKEVKTLQDALDETRHDLTEANEAREASETCSAALREFIAGNIGTGEVKLPPLPAATTGDEEPDPSGHKRGWSGFKLWKVDTAVNRTSGPSSAATATGSPVVPPPAALSRKLTGFFSSRASISSIPSLAPLQTGHARATSVYSVSDVSSLAEPISPTTNEVGAEVRVRDAAGGSPDLTGVSPEAVQKAPLRLVEDDSSLRSV
ncbi:hypothetical protein C8F01DRAFT_1178790 [Mycena amicta]|nr:hypothetical protein C8F01DRAFT_1178790 [Mycena amicta]